MRFARYGLPVAPTSCSTLAAVAALIVFAAAAPGCFNSACFVKDCDESGNNCKCSVSNCADGSTFDTTTNQCRCVDGTFSVQGQCLPQAEANAYCGAGKRWQGEGCVSDRCASGEELDQSTGKCVSRQAVNQLAAQQLGVQVGAGQQLGCPEGQKLIVDGANAVCVPLALTCARDETWDGKACVKVGACAAGSAWDPAQAKCVEFAKANGSDELKVDVAKWLATNYGPDGGAGTPAFCGAFAKKPYLFSVGTGSSATLRIQIALTFQGNEVSKGLLQVTAVFDPAITPVPPKGAAEVEASARAIFASLQRGGGRSEASTAFTTVKCGLISASKPKPVPATGGL